MSQPHESHLHEQPEADQSSNVFVRFQKGFERRLNRFRDRYGAVLEVFTAGASVLAVSWDQCESEGELGLGGRVE